LQILEDLPRKTISTKSPLANTVREIKEQVETRSCEKPAWKYINAIQQALPRDAIVTNDASTANAWAMFFLKCFQPRTFNMTRSLGALGYAFPAAIGAKLAHPDRQAVAIAGDGGFLFTSSALATGVQYRLNAVAVVFNDSAYSSIKRKQTARFGRAVGTDLVSPNFVGLAEAYGAVGTRVEDPQQIYDALRAAWNRDIPTLIEVPIEVGTDFF
jgi:acetolactate synthase-1/2/3 large subunit